MKTHSEIVKSEFYIVGIYEPTNKYIIISY